MTTWLLVQASHGYVVVGSTPTYSADVVVFPDGRVARATAGGSLPETVPPESPEGRRLLDRLISVWAADDRFLVDRISALNQATPPGRFTGRLDMAAVGVWGHSLGGAAAAQACRLDPRFAAGIDIDGTLYGDVGQGRLSQPFMFIWSELPSGSEAEAWQQNRDAETFLARSQRGGYQLTVKGTRHFNFADMAVLFEPAAKLQGALGTSAGDRGLAITRAYMRAFFDRSLKGIDSPLLGGSSSAYPEAELTAHQPARSPKLRSY